MEGREHTGVLLVLDSSGDPARREEWERSAVDTRIPETLAAGSFHTGTHFRVASGFELPAEATHMTVFETSRPSVPRAVEELFAKLAVQPGAPGPPSARAHVASYTKISEYGAAGGKRANGVVIVLCDCSDPAQEDAFNAWYEQHGRHVVDDQPHYAVTRYVADAPKPWQPKYLAIYETDDPDPGKVQRDGWEWYFSEPREPIPPMRLWCEAALERDR